LVRGTLKSEQPYELLLKSIFRQKISLQPSGKWYRGVEARTPHNRGIEITKAVLSDPRGDVTPHPAYQGVFV
jgi:hypothetical protein